MGSNKTGHWPARKAQRYALSVRPLGGEAALPGYYAKEPSRRHFEVARKLVNYGVNAIPFGNFGGAALITLWRLPYVK